MYTLVRTLPLNELVRNQLPTMVVSLGIAEVFYKLHSFLLEGAAFLVTWFVLDYLVSRIGALLGKRRAGNSNRDQTAQD